MWYIFKVVVKRSDLSNLGDRGSAEKVSNLLGVQDPCFLILPTPNKNKFLSSKYQRRL